LEPYVSRYELQVPKNPKPVSGVVSCEADLSAFHLCSVASDMIKVTKPTVCGYSSKRTSIWITIY